MRSCGVLFWVSETPGQKRSITRAAGSPASLQIYDLPPLMYAKSSWKPRTRLIAKIRGLSEGISGITTKQRCACYPADSFDFCVFSRSLRAERLHMSLCDVVQLSIWLSVVAPPPPLEMWFLGSSGNFKQHSFSTFFFHPKFCFTHFFFTQDFFHLWLSPGQQTHTHTFHVIQVSPLNSCLSPLIFWAPIGGARNKIKLTSWNHARYLVEINNFSFLLSMEVSKLTKFSPPPCLRRCVSADSN